MAGHWGIDLDFAMPVLAILLVIVVAILIWKFTFRFFFYDRSDFRECLRYTCTPDLVSLFRGEFLEDMGKSIKFSVFLWCGLGGGLLVYIGFAKLAGF